MAVGRSPFSVLALPPLLGKEVSWMSPGTHPAPTHAARLGLHIASNPAFLNMLESDGPGPSLPASPSPSPLSLSPRPSCRPLHSLLAITPLSVDEGDRRARHPNLGSWEWKGHHENEAWITGISHDCRHPRALGQRGFQSSPQSLPRSNASALPAEPPVPDQDAPVPPTPTSTPHPHQNCLLLK